MESHHRLASAQKSGWLDDEVELAFARDGDVYDHDDGVRPDSSVEKLAKLKPVFERPYGKVTAGNSSQITDGACWVILASRGGGEEARPDARGPRSWTASGRRSTPRSWASARCCRPPPLLKRQGMALADIDLWELNEAFAAQVLACAGRLGGRRLLPATCWASTARRARSTASG